MNQKVKHFNQIIIMSQQHQKNMSRPGLQIGHREKNSRAKNSKLKKKTQTQAQNSIFRHILENLYFPCYFFLNKNIV